MFIMKMDTKLNNRFSIVIRNGMRAEELLDLQSYGNQSAFVRNYPNMAPLKFSEKKKKLQEKA